MSSNPRHKHDDHPMGLLAFLCLMVGGTFSALWLITLTELPANKTMNITYGCLALFLLASTVVIYTTLTRSLHHSPMVPDNTPEEVEHYLEAVGRSH